MLNKKVWGALALLLIFNSSAYAQVPVLKTRFMKDNLKCLTDNMYYEAGILGYDGMLAVGHVTVNRTQTGIHGRSICAVVYQKYMGRYQFNWIFMPKPKKEPKLYGLAQSIARKILAGITQDPTNGAIFFAVYEDGWFRRAKATGKIIQTYEVGLKRFYKYGKK